LRVVFAGTPQFAVNALAALHGAGHDIPLVLTQPDRPSGRGLRLSASPVALWAQGHGLAVVKPSSLRDEDTQEVLRSVSPDVMVVAAYGLILPAAVLAIPVHGCLNVHASLLPRWRGAAPIQRALLAGDSETGVCIMQMDTGLDTGPVLSERRTDILESDTGGSLTERLAEMGGSAIVEALEGLESLRPRPQDASKATYASKVLKGDALIDWTWPAEAIARQVRAFDPSPGAETRLLGAPLKVWRATPVEGLGTPGEVLQSRNNRLVIACKKGALELLEIQRPGGRRMAAPDFLRGVALAEGQELGQKPLASP
jgi:methionyl-tRNA formyltransferase